jgi:hypothetical protein
VTDEEIERQGDKLEKLGVRDLDITDANDPDIYALTFYTFMIKDIDTETSKLVFKSNVAFMLQMLLFHYILNVVDSGKGIIAKIELGGAIIG